MPRRNFFRGVGSDRKNSKRQDKPDQKIQERQQTLEYRKEHRLGQQHLIQQQHGLSEGFHSRSPISEPPLQIDKSNLSSIPYQVNESYFHPRHLTIDNISRQAFEQRQDQPFGYSGNEQNSSFLSEIRAPEHEQRKNQQYIPDQKAKPQKPNLEPNFEPTLVPTVENAVDEIWRCATDDFRSASLSIQLLRLAVVSDWERKQQHDTNEFPSSDSYDPSETFLCLQGAALRFHACLDSMRLERSSKRTSYHGNAQSHCVFDEPDSLEWELTEQSGWEVWEESIRAAAALAHASIGPAWRYQLSLRHQLIRVAEIRSLYDPGIRQGNSFFHTPPPDVNSVGGLSSSSIISFDSSNPQSSALSMPQTATAIIMPDLIESFRVIIPEVLPAAMIRFAASVGDYIPPLRTPRSKIVWSSEFDESAKQHFQFIILRHIDDERRWIRRRRRLGDAQRDLAFALFCVGETSKRSQDDAGIYQASSNEWTIPGVHIPMAKMIFSWLASCTAGWPVPKLIDEVPSYIEEVTASSSHQDFSFGVEENEVDAPPSEIILDFPEESLTRNLDDVHSNEEGGATGGIRVPFSYWEDAVSSRKDWWYTLRVLRDCSDLISSGWRPPPSLIGNEVVSILISIALEGFSLFGYCENCNDQSDQELCKEERLIACSCAAESLAALKNLASRDVLPLDSTGVLSTSLCRLLSASEKLISSSKQTFDDSTGIEEQDTMFVKETLTQRNFVASNSAELLWILLSTESTCCSTVDALLDLIDGMDLSDEYTELGDEDVILTASGAVRALSAALWGDPPSVKGVPLLRYFWELVIDLFSKVLNTCANMSNDSSISFALEIILALRRLVDSEMVYGNGDLCPTEWESFIRVIDVGISPWFGLKSFRYNCSPHQELFDEVDALFIQIQHFLLKASEAEFGMHPIIDNEARNNFHILLLRRVAPKLSRHNATTLGLAAIKSWSVVGYLPCREGDWLRHATTVLSEVFSKYEDVHNLSFPGGYIHSPLVRLEAFQSLVIDECINIQQLTDSVSVSTSTSAVTSGTGLSGNFPMLSLFTLTRNLRDLHLDLINTLLLPVIIEILAPEYESSDISTIQTTHIPAPPNTEEVDDLDSLSEMIKAEFLLRIFAVRVIGLLFKSRSGEGAKRQHFIALLQHLSVNKPHGMSHWTRSRHDANDVNVNSLRDIFELESFRLHLETIRQLETCLHVPFHELPHTHGTVPATIHAICETATFYSSSETMTDMDHDRRSYLILASIIPLSRLSCSRNGQGIFLPRQQVNELIPFTILSVINDDVWTDTCESLVGLNQSLPIVFEDHTSHADCADIAPFVFVRQCKATQYNDVAEHSPPKDESKSRIFNKRHPSNGSDRGDKTIVDFGPVVTVINEVLRSSNDRHTEQTITPLDDSLPTGLSSIIRILCFNTISSFLSRGISLRSHIDDTLWLESKSQCANELVSKSESVSLLATIIGHILLSPHSVNGKYASLFHKVCDALVTLSTTHTHHPVVVKNSCNGLVSMLTSLRKFGSKMKKEDNENILGNMNLNETLNNFIEHSLTRLENDKSEAENTLIPLMNATRAIFQCPEICDVSKRMRRRIFLACLNVSDHFPWHFQVILLMIGAGVADLMTLKEANQVLFLSFGADIDKYQEVGSNAMNNRVHRGRIRQLLYDILRFKILNKHLTKSSGTSNRKPFRVHSHLARKMIAIDSFPPDTEARQCSAWKCGNTLLTLRMGSKHSVYRGWAEVIVRSPSSTIRRLAKVVKTVTSQDPDSFLTYWELLQDSHNENAYHHKINDVDSHQAERPGSEINYRAEEERNEALTNAKKLVKHFDQLVLDSAPTTKPDFPLDEAEKSLQTNNQAIMPESITDSSLCCTKPEFSSTIEHILDRRTLKRNKSDGDVSSSPAHLTLTNIKCPRESVYSWMRDSFGNDLDEYAMIRELEYLGFSKTSLGLPSKCCSESSLFSHMMVPCSIGTNFFRAVTILDRTTPFQTHRVSLLYAGPLSKKSSIKTPIESRRDNYDGDHFLLATQASTDFWSFAKELGDFVPVRHLKYFSGGLDTSERSSDGSFAIVWFSCRGEDDVSNPNPFVDSMVMFHTVTLMPNKVTNRKRHVGNDIVHIVYGLETETLDVDHERLAISGQFGFVTIYVIPFVCIDMVKISIHLKNGLDQSICSALSHLVGSRVVSKKICAETVRSLAQEADLICLSLMEDKLGLVLNIEERAMKLRDMNRHLKGEKY